MRIGPGQPRDVLATLLNGSHFNYVMLGSPADPNVLDRVMLMANTGGAATSAAVQPTNVPEPQNQAASAAPVYGTDSANDEFADDAANNTDADDQTAQEDDQQQQAEQPQPSLPPNDNQPLVKTPQQMLLELQQRQQQLQQQQQQQLQNGYPQGAPQGFPIPPGAQPPQPPQQPQQ